MHRGKPATTAVTAHIKQAYPQCFTLVRHDTPITHKQNSFILRLYPFRSSIYIAKIIPFFYVFLNNLIRRHPLVSSLASVAGSFWDSVETGRRSSAEGSWSDLGWQAWAGGQGQELLTLDSRWHIHRTPMCDSAGFWEDQSCSSRVTQHDRHSHGTAATQSFTITVSRESRLGKVLENSTLYLQAGLPHTGSKMGQSSIQVTNHTQTACCNVR